MHTKTMPYLHDIHEGGVVQAAVGVGVLLGGAVAVLRHSHRILPRQHALCRCVPPAACVVETIDRGKSFDCTSTRDITSTPSLLGFHDRLSRYDNK